MWSSEIPRLRTHVGNAHENGNERDDHGDGGSVPEAIALEYVEIHPGPQDLRAIARAAAGHRVYEVEYPGGLDEGQRDQDVVRSPQAGKRDMAESLPPARAVHPGGFVVFGRDALEGREIQEHREARAHPDGGHHDGPDRSGAVA